MTTPKRAGDRTPSKVSTAAKSWLHSDPRDKMFDLLILMLVVMCAAFAGLMLRISNEPPYSITVTMPTVTTTTTVTVTPPPAAKPSATRK